jgi:hypothetical protein
MFKLFHPLHSLAEHFMQLLVCHLALSFREIAKLLLRLLKVLGLLVLLLLLLRMLMLKGTLETGQISLGRLLPLLGIRSMHEGTRDILVWLLNQVRIYRHAAFSPHYKVTDTHDLFVLFTYFLVLHSYKLLLTRL